jgi:hypothetical protein
MSFAHPLALLLLLLLIPVALLYWMRLRVPRAVVGTSPFWQQALAEEPFRARWQRWRTPVSLLLHGLAIILLALAAAGPAIPPPQRIVLILDNSATMRATDVQPTRLEAAKEAARKLISNLRWCDEMAIVATNGVPKELRPATSSHKLLESAIESVEWQASLPALDWAMKLAKETSLTKRAPTQIVLITDASSSDAVRIAQSSGAEVLRVGKSTGNQGITGFTARRTAADPAQCEVFVEVTNRSDEPQSAKVQLSVNGRPVDSVAFAMEKDGRWQHVFEKLALPTAARVTANITPEDAYPFDDVADLDMPAPTSWAKSTAHRAEIIGGQHLIADLRAHRNIADGGLISNARALRLPLWISLAAVAALLILLEWCLYQRRWTS